MFHSKQIGRDLHAPSQHLVENNTGTTIGVFSVVRLNAWGTSYPQVVVNNGSVASFGITTSSFLTGTSSMVCSFGLLYGSTETPLNTNSWTPNTLLYCSISGTLTNIANGVPVAYVVKQDAVFGVVFVLALNGQLITSGGDWLISGNSGLGPSNFLGTTDSTALKFKTNNIAAGEFDSSGRFALGSDIPLEHFYQKSHSGYADSGLRKVTISVNSTSSSATNIFDISIPDNKLCSVKFHVIGRQSDGTQRCAFTRTGLFYRQGSNVLIEGSNWQSDLTIRSTTNFTVSNNLGVSTLSLRVRNSSGNTTYWVGYVEYQILGTDI